MHNLRLKKIIAVLAAAFITATSLSSFTVSSEEEAQTQSEVTLDSGDYDLDSGDYELYLKENSDVTTAALDVSSVDEIPKNSKTDIADGKEGAFLSKGQKSLTYTFNVETAGRYNISVDYYALAGKGKDIVFSLEIDGKLPFKEAEKVKLSRVFKDAGEIERDQNGNDLRPSQTESFRWNNAVLYNTDGYYDEPYSFNFDTVGIHTVTLKYSDEEMLVGNVTLKAINKLMPYSEYSKGAEESDKYINLYEAEKSFEKSSSMLYPTYDRSDAATSPSHYSKMRYNTIGQSNWSHQGQWISWRIEVPADGWYKITLKARQNFQQGINSYRTLTIDGEIPFEEVKNIKFPYKLGWYMKTLSDDDSNPYLFNLTAGEHILKLEVAAGPMGESLKELSKSVLKLNSVYRSIIMVTGTAPDKYRTYYLEESIPDLFQNIKEAKESLNKIYYDISKVTGASGSQASTIKEMSTMLDDFLKKPLKIPERISAFKDNIESLGSLILVLSEQPLELDYIVVSAEEELPRVKAGFFEGLVYQVKGFVASFIEDYNSIGSSNSNEEINKNITVWISNGRDQAQILNNLIDNKFTPETKIGVKLSIVATAAGTSSSTLVQATLAGKGPDVALFTPKDTPVNLAMRGALADISKFEGYDELKNAFYDSAWIPYIYEGGVYGVPETQNYDMLFYRTDIFEELGLKVPETWEEFYSIIELLQKNNLSFGVLETNALNAGISSGISFFEKLLLQNGGTYYTENLDATAFNTEIGYDAFTRWTELYTEYGLDRSFDFFNRFRTGEMPIGIMSFTTYNQLYAAAPEIRGLWSMTKIPGTKLADGSIARTETSAGTAAIMLDDCKDKECAWEFIKWWVDAETQSSYGTELEASLGVAARYDTANKQAFSSIGWSDDESKVLISQWEEVTDIKQIPGNYFISRCLTNAFRAVVDENMNPVRALNTYNKDMNAEITRKRAEFGLD